MNASIITGSQWNTFYKDQVTAEIRDHNTITGLYLGNQQPGMKTKQQTSNYTFSFLREKKKMNFFYSKEVRLIT